LTQFRQTLTNQKGANWSSPCRRLGLRDYIWSCVTREDVR